MSLTEPYHIPVLLHETVEGLNIHPNGTYIDVTLGGGGHSREILHQLGEDGRLFSFDQDADAEKNCPQDKRCTFIRSNFRYLTNWMRYHDVDKIDGLLADLGVSSHHFDDEHRGFSFRFEAPLDMRMNYRSGQTAADVLNTYDEAQLSTIFRNYGELKNGKRLAQTIVQQRTSKPFTTVNDLITTVRPWMGREREKKDLAKVFQALRIEVNHEMDALQEMLIATTSLLRSGGRIAVLTYHSLEDRMVKNFFRSGNTQGEIKEDFYGNRLAPLRPINNKVIIPSEEEQATNPRSRSAKLRIAEKISLNKGKD